MFICRSCEQKMEYCRGVMRSVGPCEMCGRQADCLDARQYKVSDTPRQTEEERSDDERSPLANR